MLRIIVLAAVALTLAGCITDGTGLKSSVAGSCAVFERPPYAVAGKTQYDQDVADKFVESGVAGCNWDRPAPRPPELDRMPAPKSAAQPAKRMGLGARIRHKVAKISAKMTRRPAQPSPAAFPDQPVAPVPATPVAPEPPAVPATPPERSRIEQLLRPNG